jgi:hypothetical protein
MKLEEKCFNFPLSNNEEKVKNCVGILKGMNLG